MPGVELFGTTNLPVVGSIITVVSPPLLSIVIWTLSLVTGPPLSLSLLKISILPPVRGIFVSGSSLALIVGVAGTTFTVTVATLEQAVGVFLSQIR